MLWSRNRDEGAPALELGPVRTAGDPENGEVENAFLTLRATPWRFLIRIRVRFAEGKRPVPRTEAVSAQRIGFSGVEER